LLAQRSGAQRTCERPMDARDSRIATTPARAVVAIHGAESRTLKKHTTEIIEAFEMWCYRRGAATISYVDHASNDGALKLTGQSRLLLGRIISQKLYATVAM